jgi:hypothetical protein
MQKAPDILAFLQNKKDFFESQFFVLNLCTSLFLIALSKHDGKKYREKALKPC